MFKFLHAADIHLDSPLKGLERYEGAPVEQIRQASRRAFEGLVRLAIDERVAFVLIAGDLYDQDWQDYNVGLYFVQQMAKLREAGIRVFLINGNHDAANRMTRQLSLHDNVTRLPTDHPDTKTLDDIGVAIHGQGFASREIRENLAEHYPASRRGWFNIGMLHTSATGREGHETYAPCSVQELLHLNYDYWALGHVHTREIVHDDPPIVFPGNVQGRHVRETGPKGCMLVTVADDRSVAMEFRCLDVLRWETCRIDSGGARQGDDVLDSIAARLLSLRSQGDGKPLAVRVEVVGQCSAHAQLLANPQHWTNEIRARAIDIGGGDIWIEKVKLATAPQGRPVLGEGPLAELLDVLDQMDSDDGELGSLREELADLDRKLPAELKQGADAVNLGDAQWLRGILQQVQPLLVSRLLSRENPR